MDLIIKKQTTTLVDQVEDKIFEYLSEHNLKLGDSLPTEMELADELGVTRSVVREAISRLKMMGVVESRTRRGMILTEPSIFRGMKRTINPNILSDKALLDLLGFRMTLEIGITPAIFKNITLRDIEELEYAVRVEIALGDNMYANISEHQFHAKLYEITRNDTVKQFQEIILPVIDFVKTRHKDFITETNARLEAEGNLVTHAHLLDIIKCGDQTGYMEAIQQHFHVYDELIKKV